MWFIISCILSAILAFIAFTYLQPKKNYWLDNNVPFINSNEIASLYEMIMVKKSVRDVELKVYKLFKNLKFGGIIEPKYPHNIIITDLDLVKQIMVKDFDYFTDRRTLKLGNDDEYINQMLVNRTGQEWKDLRAILSPTFTSGRIRRMFEHFNRCGNNIVDYIKTNGTKVDTGYEINVHESICRYAVDVIAATAFGMDTSSLKDPDSMFYKMAKQSGKISMARKLKLVIFFLVPWLYKALHLTIMDKEVVGFFESILNKALKYRLENMGKGERQDDFLQILLEKRSGILKEEDETDSFEKEAKVEGSKNSNVELSDDVIRANTLLFFLVGFDTITTALGFAVNLLALNVDIQERLRTEISKFMEEGTGLNYDAIVKMEYLDMFISETLRLYSPAPRLERQCIRDYVLPGSNNIVIKKKSIVIIPVFGFHMDEEYFPDPEKFDPERFSAENKTKIPNYAYMPFGAGPRNCIGMRFALMETKVALAHLIHNFLIEPAKSTPSTVAFDKATGSVRVSYDLEVKFTPLSK